MRTLLFLFVLIDFVSRTQVRITIDKPIEYNLHLYKVIRVPVMMNDDVDHWVYWMAEDLRPSNIVPNLLDMKTQEDQTGIGRFVNGSFDSLAFNYNGAINSCPSGWRLPTIKDWDTLINVMTEQQRMAFFNVLNVSKEIKSDTLYGNIFRKEVSLNGGYYWTYSGQEDTAWRIEIDPKYYNISKGKSEITDFLLVRCMRNEEEE